MTYNPFSLSGKTVLITGAASGIGRATAIECCRMGAEVIITDINPDGLEETFRQLPEQNGTHIRIVADLTKEEEIESLADRLPRLDGCVNNAGIMKLVLTPFLTTEIIERIQKINLIAPMMLTRNLIKKKKMRMQNRDEKAEQLKEIINQYSKNPEYVNAFYTQQEAVDALNRHYKNRYIKINLD